MINYLKDENLQSFFTNEMENIQSSQMVRELTISNQQGEENLYQITLSPLLGFNLPKDNGLITVIRNITAETQSRSLKDIFYDLLHMNLKHL